MNNIRKDKMPNRTKNEYEDEADMKPRINVNEKKENLCSQIGCPDSTW